MICTWLHTKLGQPCLTHGLKKVGLIAQGFTSFQWPSNNSSVLKLLLFLAMLCFSCIWHKTPSTVSEIYSCSQTLLLFALTESPWASPILSVTGQSIVINIHACKRYNKRERGVQESPNRPIHVFSNCFWLYHLLDWNDNSILCSLLPAWEDCQQEHIGDWWFALAHGHLSNGNATISPAHFI